MRTLSIHTSPFADTVTFSPSVDSIKPSLKPPVALSGTQQDFFGSYGLFYDRNCKWLVLDPIKVTFNFSFSSKERKSHLEGSGSGPEDFLTCPGI